MSAKPFNAAADHPQPHPGGLLNIEDEPNRILAKCDKHQYLGPVACPKCAEQSCTGPVPGYESLGTVLTRAYDQAARGKGKERHACDRPFTEQPMQTISELLGSPIGLQYQAIKKIQESNRLDKDAQVRELLGAINYIAGAVIFIEGLQETPEWEKREGALRSQIKETAALRSEMREAGLPV